MPPHARAETQAQRRAYLALLAIVVPLGFATKLYTGPAAAWASSQVGGLFYVVFWVLVILAVAPGLSGPAVALGVLMGTSALEVLQLWHPAFLEPFRSTFVGHALIGSTFSWSDFPYYAIGAGIAYGLSQWVRAHRSGRRPT